MSAERKLHPLDEAHAEQDAPLEPFALKQQVAERLAAHRARRTGGAASTTQPTAPASPRSRIAAAVAERYSHSKTYRDFLAEEAARAVREAEEAARQAEAAAEIAQRNAQALAQVQYDLLAELNDYAAETTTAEASASLSALAATSPQICHPERSPKGEVEGPAFFAGSQAATGKPRTRLAATAPTDAQLNLTPAPSFTPADLTVRLAEDIRLQDTVSYAHRARRAASSGPAHEPIEDNDTRLAPPSDPSEFLSLDEEIAFRQAPVFEPVEPPVEIPANLIEFPRQLVASRRARPRLAEGPLREEAEQHHDPSQLRIFEVEAEQISSTPVSESSAPEWSSMVLDAHPRTAADHATPTSHYVAHSAHPYADQSAYGYADHSTYTQPADYAPTVVAQHLKPSPETQHLYAAPFQAAPLELRLMSAAVDTIAVLAGFVAFSGAFAYIASRFAPGGLHITLQTAAISTAGTIVLLGLLYQYLFFTFSDATLGMRYARIGLCTFSDDNPTREALRRRILAVILSTAPCGLGVIWSLLDEDRLSWHDRISRMYQRSY